MIGKFMEVYIDDVVVKSQDFNTHLKKPRESLFEDEETSIKNESF